MGDTTESGLLATLLNNKFKQQLNPAKNLQNQMQYDFSKDSSGAIHQLFCIIETADPPFAASAQLFTTGML